MNNKFLRGTSIPILVIFLTVLISPAICTYNVPSDWSAGYIEKAAEAGLIPDSLNNGYKEPISRLEFSDLIIRLIETVNNMTISEYLDYNNITLKNNVFNDTDSKNVNTVYTLGIVLGYGNKVFDPNGAIPREQAATILYRTALTFGYYSPSGGYIEFQDDSQFSTWSVNEIRFVSSCKDPITGDSLMQGMGDGIFSPKTYLTREQAFTTLLRLYNIVTAA